MCVLFYTAFFKRSLVPCFFKKRCSILEFRFDGDFLLLGFLLRSEEDLILETRLQLSCLGWFLDVFPDNMGVSQKSVILESL